MKKGMEALFLVAIAIVIFCSGCADLSGIRKFAIVSSEATQKFDVIAHGLSASCKRQYNYQHIREARYDPQKLTEVFDLKFRGPNSTKQPDECQSLSESELRLTQINQALVNYFQALADLADDKLTSYDKQLESLSGVLSKEKLLTDRQKSAFNNVAQFPFKAACKMYTPHVLIFPLRSEMWHQIKHLSRLEVRIRPFCPFVLVPAF